MARAFYRQYQRRGLGLGSGVTIFDLTLPSGSYVAVVKTMLGNPRHGVFYSIALQLGNQVDRVEAHTSADFEGDVMTLTVGATLLKRSSLRMVGFGSPNSAFSIYQTSVSVIEVDSVNGLTKVVPTDVSKWMKSLVDRGAKDALPKKMMNSYETFLTKLHRRLMAESEPSTRPSGRRPQRPR